MLVIIVYILVHGKCNIYVSNSVIKLRYKLKKTVFNQYPLLFIAEVNVQMYIGLYLALAAIRIVSMKCDCSKVGCSREFPDCATKPEVLLFFIRFLHLSLQFIFCQGKYFYLLPPSVWHVF